MMETEENNADDISLAAEVDVRLPQQFNDDISVSVSGLSLDLPAIKQSGGSRFGLRSFLGAYAQRRQFLMTTVLDDLSFEFKSGDRVGLIGRNGAGKTTLLKVLAGVFTPTTGHVNVKGHVLSLINSNLGFNQEASGYENILLRGLYLNIPMKVMEERAESIIKFSELGDYIHMPFHTYSAGMKTRLSFAILMSARPQILLLDEWLGRGDAQFQRKAADRMMGFVRRAGIVVLASHNERLIETTCNRIIRLENGHIVEDKRI